MKTRERKQQDLDALTASLENSTSAMIVSFNNLTVAKDMEFRNRLREAGAKYQVVKNTLARIAVKGTDFEQASEAFKGVTAIAWTDGDPVVLSKAVSKFMKDNADNYTFKSGVVDGRLVDLQQLTTIASLPSKEELISKLLYVINAQAQRIVTVINRRVGYSRRNRTACETLVSANSQGRGKHDEVQDRICDDCRLHGPCGLRRRV